VHAYCHHSPMRRRGLARVYETDPRLSRRIPLDPLRVRARAIPRTRMGARGYVCTRTRAHAHTRTRARTRTRTRTRTRARATWPATWPSTWPSSNSARCWYLAGHYRGLERATGANEGSTRPRRAARRAPRARHSPRDDGHRVAAVAIVTWPVARRWPPRRRGGHRQCSCVFVCVLSVARGPRPRCIGIKRGTTRTNDKLGRAAVRLATLALAVARVAAFRDIRR